MKELSEGGWRGRGWSKNRRSVRREWELRNGKIRKWRKALNGVCRESSVPSLELPLLTCCR